MISSCVILILNYNGINLLEKILPSITSAAKRGGDTCGLLLVDNLSSDDSVEYVRTQFPDIEIYNAPKNDYLFSLNEVIRIRDENFVVVLNNDIQVERSFLPPVLKHFNRPDVFAVTCAIYDWDGKANFSSTPNSLCYLRPKNGWYEEVYLDAPNKPCFVQLASGAASAFRRETFVELGGFDTLFRPGYCEDTDLSIRAWQQGLKIIYEPRSIVYHMGSASMRRFLGPHRRLTALRNHILLMLKVFQHPGFLERFLLLYPKRVLQHLIFGDKIIAHAMLMALPRLPKALLARLKPSTSTKTKLAEAEILSYINEPLLFEKWSEQAA